MNAYHSTVAGHVALGSLAIFFYWAALVATKGSPRHRAWGKALLTTLLVVTASVGPLLFLAPGFQPGEVVQFVYLALCVPTVVMLAWTSIRWKNEVERFRGWHFKLLGITLFLFGLLVLAAGVATHRPLTMLFSWIGLGYGGAMIRFAWMRARPDSRWWLGWHLNAVCGLFNAIHGTFLAVAWRLGVDPSAGDGVAVATQLATIAGGVALRVWHGRRRGAPWRFSMPAIAPAAPAA
jgi:hypothetical protein